MSTKNLPQKVDSDPAQALAKLLEEFGPGALKKVDDIARAFKLAEGVKQIAQLVRVHIDRIMPLQGSSLGFRTDKDSAGGYPAAVVAECATEALLRGLRLTGNEMNIIAGRCYVTQAGCARLVAELEGLTDLEHAPGIPASRDGGAIVEYTASWKYEGKPMTLTRKIPIRVNNGMGADAILGKAKRKMLAAIYERMTGSVLSDGDTDDPALSPAAPSKPSQLAERMKTNLDKGEKGETKPESVDDGISEPPSSLFGNTKGLPD